MTTSHNSMFHPATHIVIAIEIALVAIVLPSATGAVVLLLLLITTLAIPPRTEFFLTRKFLKLLVVGAFFLFLIHGMQLSPPGLSYEGLSTGLEGFIHLAAPIICVIYLSRHIRSEELFAMLIDYRIPPSLILILFRTMWLVPRLTERMDEVMTAQKLRGMRVETTAQRIRALIPTLNPIFSSMLNEISINSLIMTSRGFLSPGLKTHIVSLSYSWKDAFFIAGITFSLGMLWY
ncbi:energy-coupling factor transporter transmembrane component T family protein [Candidatus Omnitrophota bacterium]